MGETSYFGYWEVCHAPDKKLPQMEMWTDMNVALSAKAGTGVPAPANTMPTTPTTYSSPVWHLFLGKQWIFHGYGQASHFFLMDQPLTHFKVPSM